MNSGKKSFKVMLGISAAGEGGRGSDKITYMQKIVDFTSEENFNMYEGDMFDELYGPINKILPSGYYVDDVIEVVDFVTEGEPDLVIKDYNRIEPRKYSVR